jgi:hypothetical protein
MISAARSDLHGRSFVRLSKAGTAMALSTLGRAMAMTFAARLALASTGESQEEREVETTQAEPLRTGKERLGSKASDEQRVDNCKVPIELRGHKPRPDDCRDRTGAGSQR